jgi:hypothetical protein
MKSATGGSSEFFVIKAGSMAESPRPDHLVHGHLAFPIRGPDHDAQNILRLAVSNFQANSLD